MKGERGIGATIAQSVQQSFAQSVSWKRITDSDDDTITTDPTTDEDQSGTSTNPTNGDNTGGDYTGNGDGGYE